MNATGIILAGGKSSRMGTNKALLKLGNTTVIETIVRELQSVTEQILIVTNTFEDYQFLGLPMFADIRQGLGPLAGLEAGLTATQTEKNVIVACDMPFISRALVVTLLQHLDESDAVVPRVDGRLHPLFAAYRKSCLPAIQDKLELQDLRIRSFYDQISLKIVDETFSQLEMDSMSLFNMNDPHEYEKAVQYFKMK